MKSLLELADYETLFKLGAGAGTKELRASYYELSRRYHPDRFYRKDLGQDADLIEDVFAGINEAYQNLSSRLRRGEKAGDEQPRRRRRKKPEAATSSQPTEPSPEDVSHHEVRWDSEDAKKRADKARFRAAQSQRKRKRTKPKAKKGPAVPSAVEAFKQRMIERIRKGKEHYRAGKEAMDAENWSKASSSFYLATQFDPKNERYREAFDDANTRARQVQIDHIVAMGDNAEQYGSLREAVTHFARAVELDPPNGEAHYRLGRALRRLDENDRGAVDQLRKAVGKGPRVFKYRLELARAYEGQGLQRNAHREYRAAVAIDGSNEDARSGAKRTR